MGSPPSTQGRMSVPGAECNPALASVFKSLMKLLHVLFIFNLDSSAGIHSYSKNLKQERGN